MPFRNTKGIVSTDGDPVKEADVIMTAAALGLAASYIAESGKPIQFDLDPLDVPKDPEKVAQFQKIVKSMDSAVAAYLTKKKIAPSEVKFGTSPGYSPGTIIMGVYKLAGQNAPTSVSEPKLSVEGKKLWQKIWDTKDLVQYTGRGAYSGFVDNNNTEGDTKPVGPLPTARFIAKAQPAAKPGDPHPRWIPTDAADSELWKKRKRLGGKAPDEFVPWGVIGGEKAGNKVPDDAKDPLGTTNEADYITAGIKADKMEFVGGDATKADLAMYTHGMIQAIYKGYHLGPSCTPYEIAVGSKTTKMASCLPCTLFMYANGYPPTSIHLGRGESWAPLYAPYTPSSKAAPTAAENAIIRDLNNSWYEKCLSWLKMGLEILDDEHISDEPHKKSRDAVKKYLSDNEKDKTVGGTLVLDAITIHDGEVDRIGRTLKPPSESLALALGPDLLSDVTADGDTHVGVAVMMSSSAGLSSLMIPDVGKDNPVFITKPIAIELKHLVAFFSDDDVKVDLPKPISDLLKDTSISIDAFYYSTDTMLMMVAVRLKEGLIKSLTGSEALGKLFDVKGVAVRVIKCPKDKIDVLQKYVKNLTAPAPSKST